MSMKSTIKTRKCVGCGCILQSDDDSKEGYLPYNKLLDENSIYCRRCFKIKNYSEKVINDSLIVDEGLVEKVNEKKNNYAFFLIDFLNICEESINTFKQIKLDKTLVISKCDLIIKDINLERIKENIIKDYNIDSNVIFISSKKNVNLNSIFSILDKNNKKETFILGYTNAGKSTLINYLKGNKQIVASSLPNTTLNFIEMDINGYKIIDTPGFNLKNTFYKKGEFELIKKLNPVYFISPISYVSKADQIFKIEDRLYLKDFNDNSITFYVSNLLSIKKIYKDEVNDYVVVDVLENSDLVIASVGFINIKNKCKVKVNKEMEKLITIRKSIFNK